MSRELRKVGPRRSYRTMGGANTEFWAEDGMIFLEDQDTGEVVTLSQSELRGRFPGVVKMQDYADKRSVSLNVYKDPRDMWRKFLCDLAETLKEAENQGDPSASNIVSTKERTDIRTAMASWNRENKPTPMQEHIQADRRLQLTKDNLWLPWGASSHPPVKLG